MNWGAGDLHLLESIVESKKHRMKIYGQRPYYDVVVFDCSTMCFQIVMFVPPSPSIEPTPLLRLKDLMMGKGGVACKRVKQLPFLGRNHAPLNVRLLLFQPMH